MIIHIEIPIVPKAQKRDRIGSRGGKGFSYKDKSQKLEEDKLLTLLMAHKPPQPLVGEIYLEIEVIVPVPKSKPRIWRAKALVNLIRPTTAPDADNYAKQIMDVMNGVFFEDDRQVVDLRVGKYYGANPRWIIRFKGDY